MCKIAIIDHVGNKAGMDYYSGSLGKGLLTQKCEVSLYSNFVGIQPEKIDYKVFFEGHNDSNAFIKLYKYIKAIVKSSYDAYKQKCRLVVVHLFSADPITLLLVLIPKLFRLKVVVISHDVSSFINNDNKIAQRLIYRYLADNVIVHNEFSYEELLKNLSYYNEKKIRIIKHGGYLDYINNNIEKIDARRVLGLESDAKYILFFGQIKDVKGLDILLEAMSDVSSDVKLIIAGKPWKADFSKYDILIHKYNLENRVVKMIRYIEDDEREKLFFASDVNILPYRIIFQSGVLLMAMSYRLPVIASDLPANKEIINDGINGLLFKSGDSNSLADAINRFFDNEYKQTKLSRNAYNTIKDSYNWDEIAKEYIHLIKESK